MTNKQSQSKKLTDKQQQEINIIKQNLKKYYDNKNLDDYEPFFHGTSTYHLGFILKKGLQPRNITKINEVVEKNNISESSKDRVYLGNKFRVGQGMVDYYCSSAIKNASKLSKEFDYYFYKDVNTEQKRKKLTKFKPVIIQINDLDPYKKYLVADKEDNTFDFGIEYTYKDKNLNNICYNVSMDRKIIDLLDVTWAKYGYEGIKEINKSIPNVYKSLYGTNALAVKGCIKSDDINYIIIDDKEKFKKLKNESKKYYKSIKNNENYGCENRAKRIKISRLLRYKTYDEALIKINTGIKEEKNLIKNSKSFNTKKDFKSLKKSIDNRISQLTKEKKALINLGQDKFNQLEETYKQQFIKEKYPKVKEFFKKGGI